MGPSLSQQPGEANSCCNFILNNCLLQLIVRCRYNTFVFSLVEYSDMHFIYGFCNGNVHAAVEEYQTCFPDHGIPSKGVFSCDHQTMCEPCCLPSFCVQSEREVVSDINIWQNILEMVQRSPWLSTCRITSCISMSHMQVWQALHEEDLHPYHNSQVQHLEPVVPAQCMDLCHWMTAFPQLLSNILFTDEASFTPGRV